MTKQQNLFNESTVEFKTTRKKQTKVEYVHEVSIRLIRERYTNIESVTIRSPRDAFESLKSEFYDLPNEHFKILLLDTKNRIIAISTVTTGTLNSSIVHAREVFQRAILANAAAIILAHNHPSDDPTPSSEDIQLTKSLVESGNILGIHVLDHVVVCSTRYISLKEKSII